MMGRHLPASAFRRLGRMASIAAAIAVVSPAAPTFGQDFYKGKTVTIKTGFGSGGGFDNYM